MLKNVIFDFGGVVCTFSQDAILDDFCTGEAHARLKPVLFRSWQALDEGTADYEEYVAETLKLLDGEDKPFECVGTKNEVRLSLSMALDRRKENTPPLLKRFAERFPEYKPVDLKSFFDRDNFVP